MEDGRFPKQYKITDFNKDLRPISSMSTLSKVAEEFIIDKKLKPVLHKSLEPQQYGFIPKSCTTFALISMLNKWLTETDATGSVTRVVLSTIRKPLI